MIPVPEDEDGQLGSDSENVGKNTGQLDTNKGDGFLPVDSAVAMNGAAGDARALMFEDGGEVPAGVGDLSDLLSLALSSVDSGLDFGRKKHGLLKGENAEAANTRMPAVPGNPSDSGMPRPQPMPGPLPPTSNPFGKRQQFSEAEPDADDQGGIPDNDEDDTEIG